VTFPIAHRGLCEQHDENTIDAFGAALEFTTSLEIDIRATSDAVLVCTHDATLEREFGDPRRVGQVSLAELRTLAPTIPTFDEVLEHYAPKAGWYLDCKVKRPRVIDALVTTLERHNIDLDTAKLLRAGTPLPPGTACFQNSDGALLQAFRSRTGSGCSELISETSTPRELALTAPFIAAYAQGVVLPDRLATKAMLRLLKAVRLGTYVYTINDQSRFAELESLGATAVFTDAADRVGQP
jgi:glycerophosphoryl diester phosphodiesterase